MWWYFSSFSDCSEGRYGTRCLLICTCDGISPPFQIVLRVGMAPSVCWFVCVMVFLLLFSFSDCSEGRYGTQCPLICICDGISPPFQIVLRVGMAPSVCWFVCVMVFLLLFSFLDCREGRHDTQCLLICTCDGIYPPFQIVLGVGMVPSVRWFVHVMIFLLIHFQIVLRVGMAPSVCWFVHVMVFILLFRLSWG